jgi:hypothetical protein
VIEPFGQKTGPLFSKGLSANSRIWRITMFLALQDLTETGLKGRPFLTDSYRQILYFCPGDFINIVEVLLFAGLRIA